MLKKIFSFRGRISRTEYILSWIIFYTLFLVLNNLFHGIQYYQTSLENPDYQLYEAPSIFLLIVEILLRLPLVWAIITQGAKRCHDMGYSGWIQIVPLVPLFMLFIPNDPETNKYGPNPRLK